MPLFGGLDNMVNTLLSIIADTHDNKHGKNASS
jgi:hypothetical protein